MFNGALAPLADYLDKASARAPDLRFIFILDEFDELPLNLYQRGPVGDAFFLTLRAISSKSPFGFILVGGETMARIMRLQGDRLNKFRPMRLDYFDREQHWSDFETLVRMPVDPWLEITDEALISLYKESAGNPYFAKLLCSELLTLMINRRDCHVTNREALESVRRTLKNISTNSFEHFWRHDVLAQGDAAEEVSVRRRRVFLAMADVFRQGGTPQAADILNSEYVGALEPSEVERELRDLQQRKILIERDSSLDCNVPFFRK